MFPLQRRSIITAVVLALLTALLVTAPQAAKVMTTRLTSFSGTSDKGSFEEALEAAVRNAAAAAPGADRQTVWKVTRISGLSGGIKPSRRVIVTVEAHW
jgi:hypothetical protein